MKSMTRTAPSRRVELGLEHERVDRGIAGASARPPAAGAISQRPWFSSPEQRREARAAVEARHAQPVDRAVVADERGGLGVADQGVLLDARGHCRTDAIRSRRLLRRHPTRRAG